METIETEILVIGSGIAGLAFALKTADHADIIILSKSKANKTSSALAQGGLAAVTTEGDSFEKHIGDTLNVGGGLCQPDVVENIICQAPERVKDLVKWGVKFDRLSDGVKGDNYSLGREGGHRENRILHIKDRTGQSIHNRLLKKVVEHPRIRLLENQYAVDLITSKKISPFTPTPDHCLGAYVFDKDKNIVQTFIAKKTVLATGGAGKIYLYTSNWNGATGDGIAMAYRAGARVANLEFMQFHPTCLFHPKARNFLISEVLRGEGARLLNARGDEFMPRYHEMGNLAPRDVIARSMDEEIKKSGHPCIYLDITHHSEGYLKKRFPHIYKTCLRYGIDLTKEPIPVVPAAHYLCGGILTDINGLTEIKDLYAIGESSCNGLHGANRLASNSLLECLASAHNAAQFIKQEFAENKTRKSFPTPPPWQFPENIERTDRVVITHLWQEIRTIMWNYVGIVRNTRRLKRAQRRLSDIYNEVQDCYWAFPMDKNLLELRNLVLVARLTVKCALARKESIGIHYNTDFPKRSQHPHDTVTSMEAGL